MCEHSPPPPSLPPEKRDCASVRGGFATLYVIKQNYSREHYNEEENLGEVLKKHQYKNMNIQFHLNCFLFC